MTTAARPAAMLHLVSGDGASLSEEERSAAVEAAWWVFGERDPREVYDTFRFEGGTAGAAGRQLWERAEAAAIAAAISDRPPPEGEFRLEVF